MLGQQQMEPQFKNNLEIKSEDCKDVDDTKDDDKEPTSVVDIQQASNVYESQTRSYDELLEKIESALHLSKEALQMCQQIFIQQDTFSVNKNPNFDHVAGPLVGAVDLLNSSLKALEDILQLEEKIEMDELSWQDSNVRGSQNPSLSNAKILIKDCFIRIRNCGKDKNIYNKSPIKKRKKITSSYNLENRVENPPNRKSKKSSNSYSSQSNFDITNDFINDYTADDYNIENSIENPPKRKGKKSTNSYSSESNFDITDDFTADDYNIENIVKNPQKRKRVRSSKIDYNEEAVDFMNEIGDVDQDVPSGKGAKKKKTDDDSDDWFDDRVDQVGGSDNEEDNEEMECKKCNFRTRDNHFYNIHIKGYLVYRKCPWCPEKIRTGTWMRIDMNKGQRKSGDSFFTEHMTEKHPDLCLPNVQGFTCKECHQEFTSVPDYDIHLTNLHNLGYSFHCKKKCGFTSTELKVMELHLKEDHLKKFKCSMCVCGFANTHKLNEHIAKKHTRVNCTVCGIEALSKILLERHMKDNHQIVPQDGWTCCSLCGNSFRKLNQHMKQVHSTETLNCDICDYSTNSKVCLKKHKESKHEEKTFLCHLCPFVGSKWDMSAHRISKHTEKKMSCGECDYKCHRTSQLMRHIKKAHTQQPPKRTVEYKCETCFRIMYTESGFKSHMRSHDINNLIQCSEPDCDYETFSDLSLRMHFNQEHRGIRFPCLKCDFVTNIKHHLKKHVKIVHEGFVLNCDICEFTTPYKIPLRKHKEKVHNVEVTYFHCEKCSYKASNKATLRDHIENIHEGISYQCYICPSQYGRKTLFKRHLKVSHKTTIKKSDIKHHMVVNKSLP